MVKGADHGPDGPYRSAIEHEYCRIKPNLDRGGAAGAPACQRLCARGARPARAPTPGGRQINQGHSQHGRCRAKAIFLGSHCPARGHGGAGAQSRTRQDRRPGTDAALRRSGAIRLLVRRRDAMAYCAGGGPVRASSSASRSGVSAAPIRWNIFSACRRKTSACVTWPAARAQRPRPASA
jgi:hypothetical protein